MTITDEQFNSLIRACHTLTTVSQIFAFSCMFTFAHIEINLQPLELSIIYNLPFYSSCFSLSPQLCGYLKLPNYQWPLQTPLCLPSSSLISIDSSSHICIHTYTHTFRQIQHVSTINSYFLAGNLATTDFVANTCIPSPRNFTNTLQQLLNMWMTRHVQETSVKPSL